MREAQVIDSDMNRRRKYAAFYEWPDKQLKELGIVDDFVKAVAERGIELREPRAFRPDPPDCVCIDSTGNLVALEVVELVSQESIERSEKGESVFRWWKPEDFREAIANLLSRKDTKTFNGGPYAEIAILIHTDEPSLTSDEARENLAGVRFGPFATVTKAFLMFSYMPGRGNEVLDISLASHNNALERTRDE